MSSGDIFTSAESRLGSTNVNIASSGKATDPSSIASTTSSGSHNSNGCFSGFNVPHILSWKDPQETGIVLAEALGAFIVLGTSFTLRFFLKLSAYTVFLLSLAEWGSRSISGQRNGLVSSYQPSRFLPLSDSLISDLSKSISQLFSRVVFGIQHILDARDPVKGLKIGGALYVTYVLLGLFSFKGLFLTAIFLAFSLPPLYLQFKPEVDKTIQKVQGHVHGHFRSVGNKIYAKAGPQIDLVKKYVGPRGGFPGAANANPVSDIPTAGAKQSSVSDGVASTTSILPETKTANASTHPETTSAAAIPEKAKYTTVPETVKADFISGTVKPTAAVHTSNTTTTTASSGNFADDIIKSFDSVPTLSGNVPIDHEKLSAALAVEQAKAMAGESSHKTPAL